MSIEGFYREARLSIMELAADLPNEGSDMPVKTCPGWSVHDVVGHLVGIVEDEFAGTLTIPPPPKDTAVQVARWRGRPTAEALDLWTRLGPEFERRIEADQVWLAAIDIVQHEQDVRSAIGRPGRRDSDAVRMATNLLLKRFRPTTPVRLEFDGEQLLFGDWKPGDLELRSTLWETFRWVGGRRSRAQLAAMDWSDEPGAVLDHMSSFGPAQADIIE